jgi:hypothetical protein
MKLDDFIAAVEKLVVTWQPEDYQAGATHRNALAAIYREMREQVVAEAVRQRDEALAKLHSRYTNR